jgi:hypothetical protein
MVSFQNNSQPKLSQIAIVNNADCVPEDSWAYSLKIVVFPSPTA